MIKVYRAKKTDRYYRADHGAEMPRDKWIKLFKIEIDRSGYRLLLNIDNIMKDINEETMTDLLPEEAAGLYISSGKEFYNINLKGKKHYGE